MTLPIITIFQRLTVKKRVLNEIMKKIRELTKISVKLLRLFINISWQTTLKANILLMFLLMHWPYFLIQKIKNFTKLN